MDAFFVALMAGSLLWVGLWAVHAGGRLRAWAGQSEVED